MILQGRTIYQGEAAGKALVTSQGISFFGGVDPENGVVVERGHELEGQSIAGKVLVFRRRHLLQYARAPFRQPPAEPTHVRHQPARLPPRLGERSVRRVGECLDA